MSTEGNTGGDVASILPAVEQVEPEPALGPGGGGDFVEEHPEALVGGAFLGGLILAKLLKRLAP
jgi:hypothetical protein